MRILSVNQWDHFANMIISIAMLGFGVSGTILALFKQKILKHASWMIPLFMVLSSLFMLIAFILSQHDYLKFDTFLVFSSTDQLLRFFLFAFLFFLPFLAGSFAIGLIYVRHVSNIGKLYFSNLLGSGLGGVAALFLLQHLFPQKALVLCASFPLLAAISIFPSNRKILITSLSAIALLGIIITFINPIPIALSQYKSLSRTLQLPDAEVVVQKSGISSMVDIVESQYNRYAPGLSLNYTGEVPVKPVAFVNGNVAGYIPGDLSDSLNDILDYSGYKLPYLVSDFETAAIISGGTGTLVAQALRNGAEKVYAFEPEITLIEALNKWHSENYPSVYDRPDVYLHTIEARTFLRNNPEKFDLVVLPPVGSFGGTSGLQAVKENFSLTIEALRTYWTSLKKDGTIAITVYTDFPPRAPLKIVGLFVEMLKHYGIDQPVEHILAIRSWTSISFVVSKKPITTGQIESVKYFCSEMGFDPFIMPGIDQEDRVFYNYIDEPELFSITDAILESDNRNVSDNYMFYIDPSTDDKPYFSRYIKLSRLQSLLENYRWQELPFVELGYIIVWLTFIILLLLSVIFILLPVLRYRISRGKLPVFLYFGGIGLGFMFVEIILIQRFLLYLGQPVYAVSAVLAIMLTFSGVGSYFSSNILPFEKRHKSVFIMVFIIILAYSLFLTNILNATAGSNIVIKILISIIIIGLPSFFMGMPFPLGLKSLHEKHNDKIAWGWGINGFFSVIAAPLALILAVETGSVSVMIFAAIFYMVALFALYGIKKTI